MEVIFDQEGLDGEKQGYARVEATLSSGDTFEFSKEDSISIGRYNGANLEFLMPDAKGWDGVAKPLLLAHEPQIDGPTAVFLLQPAYVNKIDEGSHEVRIIGPDNKEKGKGNVFIDYVIHQDKPGKIIIINYRDDDAIKAAEAEKAKKAAEEAAKKKAEEEAAQKKAEEEAAAKKAEEAAAKKAAEANEKKVDLILASATAGAQAEADAGEIGRTNLAEKPALAGDGDKINLPSSDYAPAKAKSGKAWIWILIIIILLACAGAAAWYFLMYKPAQEAQTPPAVEQPAQPEAKPDRAPEAEKPKDTRTRVNDFFAGDRNPAAAMQLAQELEKGTSAEKDAVFRLYYYAAEQGNPEGALRYAETIDPSLPAWGTVKKDGGEAWRNYGKSPEGEQARARLKEWTENQARTGNSTAREWLREMN